MFLSLLLATQLWTVLNFDAKGDGRDPSLADVAQLLYQYDRQSDMLRFRVALWGTPRASTRVSISGHAGQQTQIVGDSIIVAIKRSDLSDGMKMDVAASVDGNDDITATIDLSAPRPTPGFGQLDFSRNNFKLPADYKTLGESKPPAIEKKGSGAALILIPGAYSGAHVFDGFIARNQTRYRCYIVTPPGFYDTPARALPAETISYGVRTWTRRLEQDVLDLIQREKLQRPVIVTHGFPGSLVAHDIAVNHANTLGGIIDVAAMPVQPAASMKDLRTPAAPEERVNSVDSAWGPKWFKYVTPETWESNNYRAEMYANDAARSAQAQREVESTPLQVKIRYLMEYMASDDSNNLRNITVPLLALVPGFNEKFLADPANAFFKTSFGDVWKSFAANSNIQVVTIPDARALLLDDQPQAADEAIAAFLRHRTSGLLQRDDGFDFHRARGREIARGGRDRHE